MQNVEAQIDDNFRVHLDLALQDKIPWHYFTSIVNSFKLTIDQSRAFINILLIELKKQKDQGSVNVKLEQQDYIQDITIHEALPEDFKEIEIKREFDIEEQKLSIVPIFHDATNSNIDLGETEFNQDEAKIENEANVIKTENYECETCGIDFVSATLLDQHREAKHDAENNLQKCNFCGKYFPTMKSLIRHVDSNHENGKNFKCHKCDKAFRLPENRTQHFKTVHEGVKRIEKRKKIKRLKKQMLKVRIGKKSKIFHNPRSIFQTPMSFKRVVIEKVEEINDVTENPERIQEISQEQIKNHCEECNITFTLKETLDLHYQSFHAKTATELETIKCDECDRTFLDETNLNRHIMKSHNRKLNENCHQCERCDKWFSTNQKLKRHIEDVHEKVRNHECNQCDKAFSQISSLKQHSMKIHKKALITSQDLPKETFYTSTPIGSIEGQCDQCDRTFSDQNSLNKHIMKRHNRKLHKNSHQCDQCNKWFSNKTSLATHVKLVHDKVKNHKCVYCAKAFGQLNTLKLHTLKRHRVYFHSKESNNGNTKLLNESTKTTKLSEEPIETTKISEEPNETAKLSEDLNEDMNEESVEDSKKFGCDNCDKKFSERQLLTRHVMRYHNMKLSKKSKQCEICNKWFTQSVNLKRHITAVHDKVKDYKCDKCDKAFTQPGSLNRHKRKQHNEQ